MNIPKDAAKYNGWDPLSIFGGSVEIHKQDDDGDIVQDKAHDLKVGHNNRYPVGYEHDEMDDNNSIEIQGESELQEVIADYQADDDEDEQEPAPEYDNIIEKLIAAPDDEYRSRDNANDISQGRDIQQQEEDEMNAELEDENTSDEFIHPSEVVNDYDIDAGKHGSLSEEESEDFENLINVQDAAQVSFDDVDIIHQQQVNNERSGLHDSHNFERLDDDIINRERIETSSFVLDNENDEDLEDCNDDDSIVPRQLQVNREPDGEEDEFIRLHRAKKQTDYVTHIKSPTKIDWNVNDHPFENENEIDNDPISYNNTTIADDAINTPKVFRARYDGSIDDAAVAIQSLFRGHKGRKKAAVRELQVKRMQLKSREMMRKNQGAASSIENKDHYDAKEQNSTQNSQALVSDAPRHALHRTLSNPTKQKVEEYSLKLKTLEHQKIEKELAEIEMMLQNASIDQDDDETPRLNVDTDQMLEDSLNLEKPSIKAEKSQIPSPQKAIPSIKDLINASTGAQVPTKIQLPPSQSMKIAMNENVIESENKPQGYLAIAELPLNFKKAPRNASAAPTPTEFGYVNGQEKKGQIQAQKKMDARQQVRKANAALTIQRVFRGYIGRRLAAQRRTKLGQREKCPNCGMLEQGGKYCKRCGRKLGNERMKRNKAKKPQQSKATQQKIVAAAEVDLHHQNNNIKSAKGKEAKKTKDNIIGDYTAEEERLLMEIAEASDQLQYGKERNAVVTKSSPKLKNHSSATTAHKQPVPSSKPPPSSIPIPPNQIKEQEFPKKMNHRQHSHQINNNNKLNQQQEKPIQQHCDRTPGPPPAGKNPKQEKLGALLDDRKSIQELLLEMKNESRRALDILNKHTNFQVSEAPVGENGYLGAYSKRKSDVNDRRKDRESNAAVVEDNQSIQTDSKHLLRQRKDTNDTGTAPVLVTADDSMLPRLPQLPTNSRLKSTLSAPPGINAARDQSKFPPLPASNKGKLPNLSDKSKIPTFASNKKAI